MYLRRDELTRTVRAPAKLNVYLEVLGRRGDGFHELETLIVPIRLWDSLTFESTRPGRGEQRGELSLRVHSCWPASQLVRPNDIPPTGDRNLVVRALELLRARSGSACGARMELMKRIPVGAGLGGGSSDAAAALCVANRAWELHWGQNRLAELAAEIGSDMPFFVHGTAAICRGRGERVDPLPGIARMHFVVVKPPAGLETADVYRAHDSVAAPANQASGCRLEQLVLAMRRGGTQDFGRWMTNRLQAAALQLMPWIARVRTILSGVDCLGHQLSGSGSAYFAICRHAQQARRVAALLRARQLGLVYATSSC